MKDSAIHQALSEFKREYAWDKSLIKPSDSPDTRRAGSVVTSLEDTSIADFLRASQAIAQQDQA